MTFAIEAISENLLVQAGACFLMSRHATAIHVLDHTGKTGVDLLGVAPDKPDVVDIDVVTNDVAVSRNPDTLLSAGADEERLSKVM